MLTIEGVKKEFPPAGGLLRLLMRTAADQPVMALDGVDLQVDRGELVGLVGPNGSGKTTLFRIVATLLEPTCGRVRLDGYYAQENPSELRSRLGLMLDGDRGFYARLTGRQNLEFFGTMLGLSPFAAAERTEELMSKLGLIHRDRRVFGYSAGMRVRLAIGRALIAEPPLLLLDEPTRSLDQEASEEVLHLVAEAASKGTAVLMSSHRLNEVSTACSRVALLVDGRIRFDGSPSEILTAGGRLKPIVDLVGGEE